MANPHHSHRRAKENAEIQTHICSAYVFKIQFHLGNYAFRGLVRGQIDLREAGHSWENHGPIREARNEFLESVVVDDLGTFGARPYKAHFASDDVH